MAETQQTNPPPNPNPEQQAEEAYWEKFEKRLDGWFEKKKGELSATGTSRAGGRTTLPGIIANLVFGPEKKD